MLTLYNGALNVADILKDWYNEELCNNYGAYVPFVGTVRSENGIDGLSFDIYEPILYSWYAEWQKRVENEGAVIKMAHAKGDVMVHESSYMAAIFSPKRHLALNLIATFVEDFKANAPIWKYDLIDGRRIYAKDRSTAIEGSGILGERI